MPRDADSAHCTRQIKGMWTLSAATVPFATRGPSLFEPVDVVPCDEAAIVRGAEAVDAIGEATRVEMYYLPTARDIAEAVLRAAGKVPNAD